MGYVVFFIGLMGSVSVMFFALVQMRRGRCRETARQLQAEYVSQGLFKTGNIIGDINGRRFEIHNTVSACGDSQFYVTLIRIKCNHRSIPLSLAGDFFKELPNWELITTRGDFGAPIRLPDEYQPQALNVFREVRDISKNCMGRGSIDIDKTYIAYSSSGIIQNTDRIRSLLDLIIKIAEILETKPITESGLAQCPKCGRSLSSLEGLNAVFCPTCGLRLPGT
jgi:hypothetical protein